MSTPPVAPVRTIAWWQMLAMDLSVAWLAVAVLYLIGPATLPEPWLALLISTGVGVISAVIQRASTARDTVPARTAAVVPVQPHELPIPPTPGRPVGQHPNAPDPGGARRIPNVPRTEPVWHSPADVRVGVAPVVKPTPRPADLTRYAPVDDREIQCPRCGSFDVAGPSFDCGENATCSDCEQSWPLDDSAPRDVFVRSWLSK